MIILCTKTGCDLDPTECPICVANRESGMAPENTAVYLQRIAAVAPGVKAVFVKVFTLDGIVAGANFGMGMSVGMLLAMCPKIRDAIAPCKAKEKL